MAPLGSAESADSHILEHLPAAVLLASEDGVLRLANQRALELLKCTWEALAGRTLADVLALQDALPKEPGESVSHEAATVLANGEHRIFGYRITRLAVPPALPLTPSLAAVFQDVTEFQTLRAERDRLLQLATVGQVLPSLLHEIKNPLAGVNTAVELLLEDVKDPATQEQLHAILGELRRVRLGLEGIGTLGRTVRSTRHHPVDFALRECFRVMESQAQSRGIKMVANVASLPLLPLEPAPLRAMVFNLVSNAIQACSSGHTITLDLHLVEDGNTLELAVEDTGKGMPPEVLARCKELFFTTRRNGSGIGLALCARSAQDAGGALHIQSSPGVGTRVSIHIPLQAPPANATPEGSRHVPR